MRNLNPSICPDIFPFLLMKTTKYIIVSVLFALGGCTSQSSDSTPEERGQVSYPSDYMATNRNSATFETPEVYELANIIAATSPFGVSSTFNSDANSTYLTDVQAYFRQYSDHPLFEEMGYAQEREWTIEDFFFWLGFRENSYLYEFKGDEIVKNSPYDKIQPTDGVENHFETYRHLVEDFARQSQYRKFYADHQHYYEAQKEKFMRWAPVRAMKDWLEMKFPIERVNSYRIVFSPLTGGTNSTFKSSSVDGGFTEALMFVPGPFETSATDEDLSTTIRIAAALFTEIDHNYVNPTSDIFKSEIDGAMPEVGRWNSQEGGGAYKTPYRTFNEYMTFAVFCLWAYDYYGEDGLKYSSATTRRIMERRGFPRYGAFLDSTVEIYKGRNENESLVDLYEPIIEWIAANDKE